MKWTAEAVTSRGVTERAFAVPCEDRAVPGIVWTPEDAVGPTALVLIGHGGNGHKRQDHILALARRLVRHQRIAAAAIDGPAHGDRRPDDLPEDVTERLAATIREEAADPMVADWKATLDALQKLPEIGTSRVGYWGLSMGTMFGLPFVAAEPRVCVAVLGLMGSGWRGEQRLGRDAPELRCPVLFMQQWHDELIPRERVFELFDAIGSDDKRLLAHPGKHALVPPDGFDQTQAFLAKHLA